MAIVSFHENGLELKKGEGYTSYENRSYFVRWVDSDFQTAAIDAQARGVGAMREIDVTFPELYVFEDQTLEVEKWAHDSKVGKP